MGKPMFFVEYSFPATVSGFNGTLSGAKGYSGLDYVDDAEIYDEAIEQIIHDCMKILIRKHYGMVSDVTLTFQAFDGYGCDNLCRVYRLAGTTQYVKWSSRNETDCEDIEINIRTIRRIVNEAAKLFAKEVEKHADEKF